MTDTRVEHFLTQLNALTSDNVENILPQVYSPEIEFIDPVKSIHTLSEVSAYFSEMYQGVEHCHFTPRLCINEQDRYALEWEMIFRHKTLAKGRDIIVDGISHLRFQNQHVCYHRDYYDLGALIYEQVPVLGVIIKKIRHAL